MEHVTYLVLYVFTNVKFLSFYLNKLFTTIMQSQRNVTLSIHDLLGIKINKNKIIYKTNFIIWFFTYACKERAKGR